MLLSNDFVIWLDVFILIASILLVIFYGKSKELKLTYSLFVYGLIFWLITLLLYYSDAGLDHLLSLGRSNFVSFKLATLGYYLFIRVFIKNGNKVNWKDILWIGVNIFVIALTFFSPLMISDEVALPDNHRETEFGPLYILYLANIILDVIFAFFYSIKNYKKAIPKERKQIKIFLIFTLLAMILGGSTNLLLPLVGVFQYQMYGTFALTLLNLSIVYLIVRLQFLNIKIILGRIIYYLILVTLVVASYYLVVFLDKSIFSIYDKNLLAQVFITILVGLFFIFFFNKINEILKKQVRTRFVNPGYDPYEVLEAFNKKISRLLIEDDLIKELNLVMQRTLRPDKVTILLETSEEDILKLSKVLWEKTGKKNCFISYDDPASLQSDQNILSIDPILKLRLRMEEEGYSGNFFITDQNRFLGILLLGSRESDINYSMYDIEFIENICQIVGMAIIRSLLYQELEQFNQTLQQKVNDQTKELQIKVQQLQEARRKERDMIDIMGHELRTPATIVKLNTELLEQFTKDVINNKEKFELYLKRIRTAVENEIKLINTLLSSAKLEGNKIELNPEEINILEDIDMSIHGHEAMAKEKGLELINNSDPNTPNIFADHARFLEILNNLIDNAIKYTEVGSVSISTSYNNETVSVSVHDTGKGIPKDELPRLGQKFYRVENYLSDGEGGPDLVRPGGTGLGLYVAFSLVEKMGGGMVVESEVGDGSVFTFTLPRMNGQMGGVKVGRVESRDMFERLGLKR